MLSRPAPKPQVLSLERLNELVAMAAEQLPAALLLKIVFVTATVPAFTWMPPAASRRAIPVEA